MKTRVALCSLMLAALGTQTAWAAASAPDDAKAAEAKAKAAWTAKVTAYQLCEAQDKTVAQYQASLKAAGKAVPPSVATPACADPGPFAYAPAAPQPREGSGAHSPAETATQAPSSVQPESEGKPAAK